MHVLDIAENSVRANAGRLEISVTEDHANDIMTLRIADNGPGIDPEILPSITDPFTTTKGKKTGLGLALLGQSAEESGGKMTIDSSPETGTAVEATFKLSHPDRKPLGNMKDTISTLVITNPSVEIVYKHAVNGELFEFGSSELDELGVDRNCLPEMIAFMKLRLSDEPED